MAQEDRRADVVVVSHGPSCLDGVVSAVVVARWHGSARTRAIFGDHARVNDNLLGISPDPAPREVWITDIVWSDPSVGPHLHRLAKAGTRLFWIDHHRTAIARKESLGSLPPFTGLVLSEARSAAWLTYDFLRREMPESEARSRRFAELERLVALTDDHDRWIHELPDSHRLGLTVGEMESEDAYRELLRVDEAVTYTAAIREAEARVGDALQRSMRMAGESRAERPGKNNRPDVVAAVCDGYASDICALWGKERRNTVFVLYDLRSSTASLRRSPGCALDLSKLAETLGGGGHPAAAGFRPAPDNTLAPPHPAHLAELVRTTLDRGAADG
jgi:oligoribonuclease NrnB/cAMP/cGMP phosphodiesterase (DHH superfamily)